MEIHKHTRSFFSLYSVRAYTCKNWLFLLSTGTTLLAERLKSCVNELYSSSQSFNTASEPQKKKNKWETATMKRCVLGSFLHKISIVSKGKKKNQSTLFLMAYDKENRFFSSSSFASSSFAFNNQLLSYCLEHWIGYCIYSICCVCEIATDRRTF